MDMQEAVKKAKLSPVEALEADIIAYLMDVYDPEMPVNIYDLGLIYRLDISEQDDGFRVEIDMTLTSAACPVSETLYMLVKAVENLDERITSCEVNLVFDPPWSYDSMNEEAKLQMGVL